MTPQRRWRCDRSVVDRRCGPDVAKRLGTYPAAGLTSVEATARRGGASQDVTALPDGNHRSKGNRPAPLGVVMRGNTTR